MKRSPNIGGQWTDLDDLATRINTRPRRVLDWDTAHDRFWSRPRPEGVSYAEPSADLWYQIALRRGERRRDRE